MLVARDSKIIRDDLFKGFSPFSGEHREGEVTIESAVQSLLEIVYTVRKQFGKKKKKPIFRVEQGRIDRR